MILIQLHGYTNILWSKNTKGSVELPFSSTKQKQAAFTAKIMGAWVGNDSGRLCNVHQVPHH